MPSSPLVVVGASAGGVEALNELVAGLPLDLPAAVLVVLHIPESGPSALAAILDRAGPLPARTAVDGEPLREGQILVAAPGRHLVVEDGVVRLSAGPRENGHRPAIDVLFRGAAAAYGSGVVAVVLSGMLTDGAAGSASVRSRGGTVLAQQPSDALYPDMPRTVISRVGADGTAPAAELGPLIAKYCQPVPGISRQPEDHMRDENERSGRAVGVPSGFICPDCNGTLYTVDDEPILRFRCRVGHAWGAENLLHEQDRSVEAALWAALRALEERAELSGRLATRAAAEGRPLTHAKFTAAARETLRSAGRIKRLLERGIVGVSPGEDAGQVPDVAESAGVSGSA